jgi:transposase
LIRCGAFSGIAATASKKSILPAEQLRPDIARRRYWWKKYLPRIDISRFVCIDETWIKTNMTRLRGWYRKGQRLCAKLPHGHWKTLTFIAALRADGLTAPGVLDGPVNRLSFEAYVEQILVPTLRPRDIVIMDNLNSHKGEAVRRMIRQAGAHLLFLPAYSPDLNPIEQAFSKFKELMRKAEERTIDGLWRAAGKLIPSFNAHECTNYFKNAGYNAA